VTTDYAALLRALAAGRIEFIIVGGLAATIHGAARATYDVDVVYARTPENLSRIVAALGPLRPYLRGAPAGLPFTWDVETLSKGLNFTLTTTAGDFDLLGGTESRCLSLEQLIQVKRAAGRVKDLEALAELEAIAEERRR
jgi:predicted nucleotidyltransferase